jgi:hypothetical protein
MPNHFHFLVSTNKQSVQLIPKAAIPMQYLTEGIRLLLSSYTKGIQKQQGFKGNLFQQKTKAKAVSNLDKDYSCTAFHYIHQNPYSAHIVDKMENWEFSSFADYAGKRNGTICNKKLAIELLDLNMRRFYEESYKVIGEEDVRKIYEGKSGLGV